jgi:transcriptional regulator with XRE-family HTH domain
MNAIKNYMRKNKLSAYKLARMVGVDPSTVYRQINGEVSISLETARKYSEKLDIPLTEILEVSAADGPSSPTP